MRSYQDASRDLGRAGAPTIAFKEAEDQDLYDDIVDSVPAEGGSRICAFGHQANSGLKATVKVKQDVSSHQVWWSSSADPTSTRRHRPVLRTLLCSTMLMRRNGMMKASFDGSNPT